MRLCGFCGSLLDQDAVTCSGTALRFTGVTVVQLCLLVSTQTVCVMADFRLRRVGLLGRHADRAGVRRAGLDVDGIDAGRYRGRSRGRVLLGYNHYRCVREAVDMLSSCTAFITSTIIIIIVTGFILPTENESKETHCYDCNHHLMTTSGTR